MPHTSLIPTVRGKFSKPISLAAFSAIVSVGTLLLYNIPFFRYVASHVNDDKAFLLVSLVVLMLALNYLMAYLTMFLLRKAGRLLLAILAVINATAVYFVWTYSVMIDATTIENVFNTRYSEASAFFSWTLWVAILLMGVLPALLCLFQPVVYGKLRRLVRHPARHRTGWTPPAVVLHRQHLSRHQLQPR